MRFRGRIRGALFASTLCTAILSPLRTSHAATFLQLVNPNPTFGGIYGSTVVALSTGNIVVTSPSDYAGGANAGAVYLFNGSTGELISTLRGSTPYDDIGSGGVTALSNGNFVILSPHWHNGAVENAGAATWGSGISGVSGVVSAANSLVGTAADDAVSGDGVTALPNGNYVVASPSWDSGAVTNVGAVTWGSGTSGVSGAVSAANSLVGTTASDAVGASGVTALSNGNYVVASASWSNGAISDVGAVTLCNGTYGLSGVVSAANSLIGSTAGDQVGIGNVTALSNGNFVVRSMTWHNGAIASAGAVTWGHGALGVIGVVSAANSLVGSKTNDSVGRNPVTALTNGNYVVGSPIWDNGGISNAGAATWGSGTSGVSGAVSPANSLVGLAASDNVGSIVVPLSNGNYVVGSSSWDNGEIVDAGAATWGNGTSGLSGAVSVANSLVGTTEGDAVSSAGVTALSNGNYVVRSSSWDNGGIVDAGAATWGSGTSGVSGAVSLANSLGGTTAGDAIGSRGVTALTNGNYVVGSSLWDNGGIADAGAATWGSGTSGVSGAVSPANSLVGSTANSAVGSGGVTALSNGNYVVRSSSWDNGAVTDVGAATWGSGTSGVSGAVSVVNSLVGTTAGDAIGSRGVTALANGGYVVASPLWDRGAATTAGAATWGSGTSGVSGAVSVTNSLVGTTAGDAVGSGGVTALSNGNYVVVSLVWNDGAFVKAGAATWGSGTSGVSGPVSAANSLVGTTSYAGLALDVVEDVINSTFIARFPYEGLGRLRVGPLVPVIVSALDIPDDQGGWLSLTFNCAGLDAPSGLPPVATYSVWRQVPGTIPAGAGRADRTAVQGAVPDAAMVERVRAKLPPGLDVREADGRLYVTAAGARAAEITEAFPPGTWELVTDVPAQQQAQYVVPVPTISNAAPNEYVVTGYTNTPSVWFISESMGGQSVDNLAPAPPTQFSGAYAGGQTNLQWAANTENDIGSYRVYRGASADFTPAPGNQIATVTSPGHSDVGPPGGYYKLSAVDVNGNESGFTLLTPVETTEVDGDGPVAFALDGVRPNPTNGRGLNVMFALPEGAAARLELLDLNGRRVLTREVGSLGAGWHTVNMAEGRGLAPGLYWVRLTQGTNRQTTRVAVIE